MDNSVSIEYEEYIKSLENEIKELERAKELTNNYYGVIDKKQTHQLGWKRGSGFVKHFINVKDKYEEHMDMRCRAIINLFEGNLEWETNRVIVNGKDITNKYIVDVLEIGNSTLIKKLNKLEKIRLIRRVGNNKARKIYVNPEYCIMGRDISKNTIRLFDAM